MSAYAEWSEGWRGAGALKVAAAAVAFRLEVAKSRGQQIQMEGIGVESPAAPAAGGEGRGSLRRQTSSAW